MKKLYLFFIKSFLGPFIFTFFIAIFLLLMQFLWKYIDDLVGKGLDTYTILQLLFYASARFVPLALPISILLSSIMTFGNIGEKNELLAIKSAGISLKKCMYPLGILIIFLGISSFLFSNYVMPIANLKAGTLLYDIRKQKPALNIKEGVFYNGLKGFSIKIDSKDENGIDLTGIMIYDHNDKEGNNKVIISEKGKMYLSSNEQYFIIALENGYSYHEINPHYLKRNSKNKNHPFQRVHFKKEILRFDISDFGMKKSSKNLYRNHYAMMTNYQLSNAIDSINGKQTFIAKKYFNDLTQKISIDSSQITNIEKINRKTNSKSRFEKSAIKLAKQVKSTLESHENDLKYRNGIIIKHKIEWHRKLSLAFACIVLFLIGAPLGSIIRKGGFGMPVIVSVGFFIIYHTVSVTGEKMAKEGANISSFEGMWASNFLLLPIGIYLTYLATTDSNLFGLKTYKTLKMKVLKLVRNN
ncbi:MAG: LptF/LptG family permease [Flavobacteriales bacterium]|tara:strand:+ start:27574 stop:28980 length:1407 start_codon:yes stop_codon:yes gene_type:complete